MKIDLKEHRILANEEVIYLTDIQTNILSLFYKDIAKILRYETIAKEIYGLECDYYLRQSIRKQISLLNKKIGKYIKIKNIKGLGYIIKEGQI